MSRTIRTNKYGETKTDKFKKNFNGCGCAYCEYVNRDFRLDHKLRELDLDVKREIGGVDIVEENNVSNLVEEDHYLNELSELILNETRDETVYRVLRRKN